MGRSLVIHTHLQIDKTEVSESSLAQQSMKQMLKAPVEWDVSCQASVCDRVH